MGQFTPNSANDLHADILDAMTGEQLFAGVVGTLSHALGDVGRDRLPGGKTVGDDLSVRCGVRNRVATVIFHAFIFSERRAQIKSGGLSLLAVDSLPSV
jgi:hypothetical protein